MDPASLPPEMRSPMMAPMIKPFTGDPVAFDVDATGRIVRARDWPATRAAMETTVKDLRPLLMAEPGGTAAIADKVTAFLIARFDQVTAEGAPDVIMQNIVPIFSWSDFSMAIGESREAAVQMPIAMFDTSVNVRAKVTLLGSDGQSVRLLDHESVDPAELQRVMKVLAARIDASKKPPAIDETALDLVGTINVTVDIPTGIVSRFDMENRQGEDGPLVQKRVITWLRQAPAS
ncbi:MAG: hypothetical protein ACTHJR_05530 [Sphingomonas sp.]|uniref:hypothetical protein n=1 Tax=Sphingomonas sp. TaxID=28214 RepID=UPI003F7E391B